MTRAVRRLMDFAAGSPMRKLLWGNGLANAIQFLSIILLSRLYAPEEFGLLAQVQSIALIGATVFTMQLHLSIPLAKTEGEAAHIAKRVETLCISYFTLSLAACFLFPKIYALAAALSLFVSLANTYSAFFLFNGNFRGISRFYIVRACLIVGAQVGFAMVSMTDGLIWATLLGEGAATLYLRTQQRLAPQNRRTILADLVHLIVKARSFSLYGTIQEIIAVAAFYAPLFLFDRFYGNAIGGQYAMANRLVWAPVALFASSAAQVLYHKYANNRPSGIRDYLNGVPYIRVMIFIIAICFFAWLWQDIFTIVLGNEWHLAAILLPLQLVWGAIFFISTPFRVGIRVFGLQKWQLVAEVLFLASIVVLFSSKADRPQDTMALILIAALIQNAFLIAAVHIRHLRSRGQAEVP